MKEINSKSLDLNARLINLLKSEIPEVFSEGKIDFDALKSELGQYVEESNERYQFTWTGKEQAKRIATTPTLGTLRPAPEESVNWDSTENVYIEGDNLEVLKLLQKSYFGKVKIIYIDPPYNTGKDFVYKDDFKDNLANYQRLTGQKDEEGNPLTTNSDSAGRFHSNWLNMMYPRLKLARNLLKDDGVIFISIDDNEVHNLRKICDEIFGEGNFVGQICWKKKTNGNNMGEIPPVHDAIVVYAKVLTDGILLGERIPEEYLAKNYQNPDNDPRGPWTTSDLSANHEGPHFPITNPNTGQIYYPAEGRYWVFNETEVLNRIADGRIIFGKTGQAGPVQKKYLNEREALRWKTESWWDNAGLNEDGTEEVKNLFKPKLFSHPKPTKLISKILEITSEDGIVLDFFSGSATTAHAVMQLNAEDGGNRQFILVQIPEPTPENSEARKAGYETITEIGKERIRRAASKIKEESPNTQADLGFKAFKLDTSNIKKWQPNIDDLETDLISAVDNIVDGRTSQDLLFEVLIKYGLPLTLAVKEVTVGQHQAFNVAFGSLVACFDENITLETVQAIADLSTPENPVLRVVFRDTSFKDDITKTNAIQRLKQAGIDDILSI